MYLQHIWFIPVALMVTATLIAFPLSRYLVWIVDGKYRPLNFLRWFENKINSGPQSWKQYAASLLIFNTVLFVFGYLVLFFQPWLPLNPDGKGLLAPSTIFNSVISFMTNTNLQHYSGDVHLSNFSQIFFCIANMFISAAIGFCSLNAIIRLFRGATNVGNFFLDMWRIVVYVFLPISIIIGIFFMQQGSPMTIKASHYDIATLESGAMGVTDKGEAKTQSIVIGPVAALEPIKMLGTNGGGFFGMNAAHAFENPTDLSNFLNTLAMMLIPFALVLMYGRMLNRFRHSLVIFSVMLLMMVAVIAWSIYFDTLKPNPAFTAHAEQTYQIPTAGAPDGKLPLVIPAVAALPVDQHLGNLEGKELRFGTSAGAAYAAITTDVTCGSVNAESNSLNPLAALSPMIGMWLNCIFGGKGVGMINMLMFVIIGIFIAGMMVGRTPEYLGRKIGAREVKLAVLALIIHPILILMPTGIFAGSNWGLKAVSNPGANGLSQLIYQFSSASANNGSAFDGLGVTYGFANNPNPAPSAIAFDISTGLIMLFGRFLPIIAMIAMAAFLGAKKTSPFGLGTLRDDTFTFGVLILATVIIIGALLFLPVAALGPIAEHFGPIPFGG